MTDLKPADASEQRSHLGPPASSPAAAPRGANRGWYSRGYLPHCDDATLIQHIIFGLADALPPGPKPPSVLQGDRLLDAGRGECVLRRTDCAELMQDILLRGDGERYRLLAWCVVPNHVHVIAQQTQGWPLGDVVQTWKSSAAHFINRLLDRKGRLWRREYFDRFMRDDDHLSTSIAYVEENPVRAKLARSADDWRWSSAYARFKTAGEDAGGPRGPT